MYFCWLTQPAEPWCLLIYHNICHASRVISSWIWACQESLARTLSPASEKWMTSLAP